MLSDALDLPKPFGPYTLLRRLAVGGMAEVYVASTQGIGGFEKLVAIKVIHPRFSEDEHFITMLVEEAKISVQLNHVNIAQTFDLGCIDETYYIAMELVEGADCYRILLRAREKKVALPVDICSYLISEVLNGLGYAHRKRDQNGDPLGIVHRDISPQNVLVTYAGEVKLVDFGIAKAALRGGQTEVGVIKGKYYYMSPEQAWGDPVDVRTDVFATGLLLHELLTSEMVYQEDNVPALLDSVRKAIIPSPREKRPEVPQELAQILAKALQKEAPDRYPSAHAFSQELSRFLYSRNPTFTASRLAQVMGTLFPEEAKGHSQVLKLPTAEEEAAARAAKPAPDLAPAVREELPAAVKESSVLFNLKGVDLTRSLAPGSNLDSARERQTKQLSRPRAEIEPPTAQFQDTPDDWEEETLLKGDSDWDDSTFVDGSGAAMQAVQKRIMAHRAAQAPLVGEKTIASAEFPLAPPGVPLAAGSSRPAPASAPPPPGRLPLRPPAGARGLPPLSGEATVASDAHSGAQTLDDEVADLPAERTVAFNEATPPPPRRGALVQPSHGGVRLGPSAARFFDSPSQAPAAPPPSPVGGGHAPPPPPPPPPPADPFAPVGGAPSVDPFAPVPSADPFVAGPSVPIASSESLGKPQPLKWIALGAVALLLLSMFVTTMILLFSGPDTSELQVVSVPQGSAVTVDGVRIAGTTPVMVTGYAADTQIHVEVSHPGYETSTADFALGEGSTRRVFVLNQLRATLQVVTDPPGAQVWVSERLRGTAPLDVALRAGETVTVRAAASGRQAMEQTVELPIDGSSRAITLTLPPQ